MTSTSISAPVIAGIVVGVALVVLFSVTFTDTSQIPDPANYISDKIFIVFIPEGASIESSGKTFTQQHTRVFINADGRCCNAVRWVNQDSVSAIIEADDDSDPDFYKATKDFVIIEPGGFFDFTFTKEGEFGYHGTPWQRGTIEVVAGFS